MSGAAEVSSRAVNSEFSVKAYDRCVPISEMRLKRHRGSANKKKALSQSDKAFSKTIEEPYSGSLGQEILDEVVVYDLGFE